MAVASVPEIKVRNIREEDIDDVFNICITQNDIGSLRKEDMLDTLYPFQRMVLVATSEKDAVDGVCFQFIVNENFVVVSGFLVRSDHPNPYDVRHALYKEVSSRFGKISTEMIVPKPMREYMSGCQFVRRWNIDRYTTWGEQVRPPLCNSDGYSVEQLVRNSGTPFTLHYKAPNGKEDTVNFDFTFREPFRSFKLYEKDSLKLVGYGILNRNDLGWVIAPLYASDTNQIKILLGEILNCIKRENQFNLVRVYVVNCSVEKGDLLYRAGFYRSPMSWTSFSRQNDIILRNWWNYAIFSLCPLVPSY